MSTTDVIGASVRAEVHSAPLADSRPKPDDGFVDIHDFVFCDGETLETRTADLVPLTGSSTSLTLYGAGTGSHRAVRF